MSEIWELMARTEIPATRGTIAADLRALGLSDGDNVIVHSSIKSIGWVVGGAPTVVQALIDVVGDRGTIVTPSHSYGHTDPASWTSPRVREDWISLIRDTLPPFDPATTPTTHMGRVVEVFRTWPGTLRSRHPDVSFCARGANAEFVTANHTYEMSQGNGSPLARLYDLDGKILFIGVGYDRNTSFHLAEYRIDETPLRTTTTLVEENGAREWREFPQIENMNDDWLRELGAAFEADNPDNKISVGRVGLAECRLFSQRAAVDFAVGWLREKWASA
ncbi:MAG: AAC(3) family N-acetyltransferase [Chloroflexi bacterium]|nr:AAC(3) family N-acetyltransferase [Chloroflexota bacterium]